MSYMIHIFIAVMSYFIVTSFAFPVKSAPKIRAMCDVDSHITGGRFKRYALYGTRWPKPQISYRFINYPRRLSKDHARSVIREAFNIWSVGTVLKFYEVQKPQTQSEINILFATKKHDPCKYDFDGKGGQLGHAYYPINGGMHFDDDEDWEDTKLLEIAVHQIGHAVGLKHFKGSDAIMTPFYKNIKDIKTGKDDRDGIAKIYVLDSLKQVTTATCVCGHPLQAVQHVVTDNALFKSPGDLAALRCPNDATKAWLSELLKEL